MDKMYNDLVICRDEYEDDEEFEYVLGKTLHNLADLGCEIRFVLDDCDVYWVQYNQNRFEHEDLGLPELKWVDPDAESCGYPDCVDCDLSRAPCDHNGPHHYDKI